MVFLRNICINTMHKGDNDYDDDDDNDDDDDDNNNNNNNNLITPCSTVFLEKLTDLQLVKKFPAFYGNRRFITEFTNAHHLSLS